MNLEENKGTCGFAFPEGSLIQMGQEAIPASAHVGGVQRRPEASHPGQCHPSFPHPVSDLWWPWWEACQS